MVRDLVHGHFYCNGISQWNPTDSFLNLIASKIAASLLSFRKERRDEMVLLLFATARTISLERDGDQGQKKKKKKGKGNYFHGENELLDRT